jgi:CHASE2 domain-containing sensor protein
MRKFWTDCIIATCFVFAVLWGILQMTKLNVFNAFDPIGQALGDLELTDIAFSQLRDDPQIDTNIIIVNIGNFNRGDIGRQIATLSQFQPKVIALDIIFACDMGLYDSVNCPQYYDTLNNQLFAHAVRTAGKRMVLAEELHQTVALVEKMGDVDIYDSIEHTDAHLLQQADEGFVNLPTEAAHQEDLKACRTFIPKMDVNGKMEYAYSMRIAMKFDSAKAKKFLDRNKEEETINYRGNIVDWHGASNYPGRYMVLDADQALDTNQFVPSMIKDKIVLLGFLGSDLRDTSWDDKFFTPLNTKYAGKARPDMYGVVVHANIISMILNEDYINEIPVWLQYLLAIVLCMANVALFIKIKYSDTLSGLFDVASFLIQIFQIILLSLLMIFAFNWASYKLNLTISLAIVALVGTGFEFYDTFKDAPLRLLSRLGFTKRVPEELRR